MAMVRNSPASQVSSRPSWPSAPTSSTPPAIDDGHSAPANLHGAIGDRRNSRSSSVSSGGSSTNSAEGLDSTRQQTQSRLSLANSAQHHQQGQDASSDHPSQSGGLKNGQASEQTGLDADTKGARSKSTVDAGPFGYFMGAQTGGEASFPEPPKIGRPITGQNSSNSPFRQQAVDTDLNRLFTDQFSHDRFVSGFQQDLQDELSNLGLGNCFDSTPFPTMNQSASSPSDMGACGGGGYQPTPSSGPFQNMGGGYGSGFQQYPPQGNIPFPSSSSYFGGNQGMNSMGTKAPSYFPTQHGFNNPAPDFNTGRRHSNDYFTTPSGNFQAFSSQDFSLPPPTQPWRGPVSTTVPENLVKKITCDLCNKFYKWPHALQCLHIYCFPCISGKFNRMDNSIICPKCTRKTITDENGPCGLKLDYGMCRYMRNMNVFPFNCTGCTRDQEAVTCCTECVAFLCGECQEGHRTINHFQGHSLSPITKIGRTSNGDYTPFCDKHLLNPLNKWCVPCEKAMCEVCAADHTHPELSNKENTHDLPEVFPIMSERMKILNEDTVIKHKDAHEQTKKLPVLLHFLDNRKRNVRKGIDEFSDYCHTVVDQNRIGAYENLEKAHAAVEAAVISWAKGMGIVEAELDGVSTFNHRQSDGCSKEEFLSVLTTMETEYKQAVAHYAEHVKGMEGIKVDLKFDPNYKETHNTLNQNFLTISYFINDLEQKVSPGPGTQRSDLGRGRNFGDFGGGGSDNSDCNYQRWSAAPESMPISTWNNVSERDRKAGTFIPHLNRYRTKTSYIHMFGEYGRGEYAFTEPSGQAYLKDGSYVICDTNNHRIVYYDAKHEFVRTIGQPPNLPPLVEDQDSRSNGLRNKGFTRQDGYLYFPNRVAICPLTQNIIATERPPSHDIQIFTPEGEFVRCFGGNILQHPRGVTVDEEGIIIVVECKVMKLVMFKQDGGFLVSHSLTKDLEFPNDVAAREQKIFISDNRGHCVQVFNYNAEFLYKIGSESITYFPIGVSINYLNQVVVTDNHNTFNITVFDLSGHTLHIFESVSKLAQCHNVAVHPTSMELMLTTKDCSVYFFNYDPNVSHPLTPPTSRGSGHLANPRRARGNGNGNSTGSSFY